MDKQYFAHSVQGQPLGDWQPLEEHLKNVARLAEVFAQCFGGNNWARLAGQNHDIGKGTLQWQAYLRHNNEVNDDFMDHYIGRVEHAVVGAQQLYKQSREAGKLLAYCIAGHHGGLPNWNDSPEKSLKHRLGKNLPKPEIPTKTIEVPEQLPFKILDNARFGFQVQFFVRMLFSCLVDADFLDTEAYLDLQKSQFRSRYARLSALRNTFWENFNKLRHNSDKTKVTKQRELVLGDCLQAAKHEPGLFSLTVPTGGGKTLSSLAFAFEHAKKYSKRRIIYVIPFSSIIEQNAAVFRSILGNLAVLEHHCNFIPDESDWMTLLATENWDAPLVVTTNVQFFDSFYSRKPSKCRKLHNVCNSVVIFDEVQAIPVEKMMPCLEVLRELSLNYEVTSLLCTATQPAIQYSKEFQGGLKNVREIVQDIPTLFNLLKRTEEIFIGTISEIELAERMADHKQVLAIVNTRKQALDIFNALQNTEGNIHLSALMYPVHRTRKIKEIRDRLEKGLPCRVVSTQLIEAGVDVDFPCVFRASSGIDSIAQAAGRCNRNGKNNNPCQVFVFKFTEEKDNAFFRKAAQSAQKLFERFNGNLTDPDCVYQYFVDYFWKNAHRMDEDGILDICKAAQKGDIQFRDLATFQMIKSATYPIVIGIEKKPLDLITQLNFAVSKRYILRKLQQYTVQIYSYNLTDISTWLENPFPGIRVLYSPEFYSEHTGLLCKEPEGCAFFA